MSGKQLDTDSQWNHFDRDGDGVITDEAIAMEQRMI